MKIESMFSRADSIKFSDFLISIVVPVFNDEKNLVSTINSVLGQQYNDCEIIIINDASTDNSGSISDQFSLDYSQIKVIHNEKNIGVGLSRNRGLSAAKGRYIMFLDSDDNLIGDCLEGLSEVIERRSDTDLIVGKWVREHGRSSNYELFEDSTVLKSRNPTTLVAYLSRTNHQHYMCWCYVIRRQFISEKELKFLDVRVAEDQEFVAKVLCLATTVDYFDSPMYLYKGAGRLGHYKGGGRVSRSIDSSISIGFIEIIISLSNFLQENDLLEVEKKRFILSRIKSVNGLLIGRLMLLNRSEILEAEQYLDRRVRMSSKLSVRFRELNLFNFSEVENAREGFRSLVHEEEKRILSTMRDAEQKEVYIFCATVDASAVGFILRQNGYHVCGLVDNEATLNGTTQDGFSVFGPEIFSSKTNDGNSNCIVIVSQYSVENYYEIVRQLMQYGLRKENIRLLKPMWVIN
jgi:glycosyltransferase involved in cell wall biosynthesis